MILMIVLSLILASEPIPVTATDKVVIIESVITHLETDYVNANVGAEAAAQLRETAQTGRWDDINDPNHFATALRDYIRALTEDGHLDVQYIPRGTDISENDDAYTAEQMNDWYGAHINFGVQSAQRLDHNVGYLDLRVFAPLDMGGRTLSAALSMLAHTDALIIDVRNNGGGITDTAVLVMSHVFGSERQPLSGVYDRPSDTLTQNYTWPFVSGDRFGPDKPVYVLTSSDTFSAAEHLAYDLQALDRAIIVGEVTGGGAHPFTLQPIHPHFVMHSVTAQSVNPITGTNWQGVGVQPDLPSEAEHALQTALDHFSQSQP